jgi:chaperonin cofactor prefoldin
MNTLRTLSLSEDAVECLIPALEERMKSIQSRIDICTSERDKLKTHIDDMKLKLKALALTPQPQSLEL